MKKILLYSIPLFLSGLTVNGQSVLTLEEAVNITLENNFDIRIAKNELKIDEQNVSLGNAGILPQINAVVINNNTIQNATLSQASGAEVEIDGARNLNISYGVGLDWTIFDGFRMFARHNQLKEIQKLGETELKVALLSKVSEVYTNYYTLVNQQLQLKALDSIIDISKFRLQTAENRFTIGKASKLEVLNAEVDLNADQSTKIRLKEQLGITKIKLNELLARPLDIHFEVIENVLLDETLLLTELQSLAGQQNPQLQIQYLNKKIQEYELKQVKASRYPTFSVNTGYNLVRSQSPFGFITESTGRNFTYGFTATLNLFDGLNQNRNEKTASLQLENTKLQIEQQSQTLQAQLSSIYQSYITTISLVELEQKNEKIARQNLDITLEKFKIGTIPPVEFRTAQVNYINAVIRLQNAKQDAKLTEIALKELAGNLSF